MAYEGYQNQKFMSGEPMHSPVDASKMEDYVTDGESSKVGKKMTKEEDFANYFCTYGYLYHQKDMLQDRHRMDSYYRAITENRDLFREKVVLDVGTGTGILALWAAFAGAKRVYAVEMTDMAKHARKLVDSNGYGSVVKVIQGSMEEVELEEQVDIIVSEWMGYFLLRESMLDSVIVARDKFLKPGGAMYPSHATMYIAAYFTDMSYRKQCEYDNELRNWDTFLEEIAKNYNVDMGVLNESFEHEQREYFLSTSMWEQASPDQLLVQEPAALKVIDLHKIGLDEVSSMIETSFTLNLASSASQEFEGNTYSERQQHVHFDESSQQQQHGESCEDARVGVVAANGDSDPHNKAGIETNPTKATECEIANEHVTVSGFLGWFDVSFAGSSSSPVPTDRVITLSTSPTQDNGTHWGQQAFLLHPPIEARAGDVIDGRLRLTRRKDNHRLLNVNMDFKHHTYVNGTKYTSDQIRKWFRME